MPTLIHLTDFKGQQPKRDPRLYFEDADYSAYNNGGWSYTVEKNYPHKLSIHCDVLDEYKSISNKFFIELRKFIERQFEGDVLFEYKSMDYRWWWNKEATSEWAREYSQIRHGYWHLYFESENDVGMFALKHGEKISKPQKFHPGYGEDIIQQEAMYGEIA